MNCNQSSGCQGRMTGMMPPLGAQFPPPGSQRPGFGPQWSGQRPPMPMPEPQRPGPRPPQPNPGSQRPGFGPPRFPVGMGYIPMQEWETPYPIEQGYRRGTIFPSLDYPFLMGRCRR